ncbi:hypothetical protein NA57DRAFT_31642 [Rhizodiscina lignyota]|uniref:Uncharacterized protein n=1 Tax=Rhizodiscina lignyota TaxID=1504668 RepID=A0A9P4IN02_9PEZI|nr:hypothetical protein NA57DRAFT_31642 [Rhizodiscina lignyota]
MGWFWGNSSNKSGGAVDKLDPDLRDFLEKEKPPERPHVSEPPPKSNFDLLASAAPPPTQTEASGERAVPKESVFQDGRYAHLWKTYRPLAQVEAAAKTDTEMLSDLVDAYKDRQARVKDAASENCIFERLAYRDCLANGSWFDRMTMCSEKSSAFFRCYEMQGKFLKALGYMSAIGDEDRMERIQMHGDKLFREMIAREDARKQAEAEGRAVEETLPVMAKENVKDFMDGPNHRSVEYVLSKLPPKEREPYLKRLENKSPEEKALEERLIEGEVREHIQHAMDVGDYFEEEKKWRAKRKAAGQSTMGDRLKSLGGWDNPPASGGDRNSQDKAQ